ncbi:hypothetical protein ANOM_001213 [Aspergillus nomiae NRRL 13137]|uniref:Uncharacterized protein n=1 Tax=Aspergillus nomiae NRRL (strain ATCC 15546 / NRRL 13137 / CBS 260.88 / M93) TaxID=1509407 RepID=A0A0L1JFB4_ASPN3|nr:uncharacterized protein ANOM_001213 [Aspergillus nomiae NRRL 13137]KNG90470.1 hypothetical protein ANOM_001213 [Aspergillus nomiae NRRL 13137]
MPDKLCMDNMEAIGQVAKSQLGPIMESEVCSKGIKPSKADWKWLEPKMQSIMNNIKKCSQKPDLPNYKPKVEKLGDAIVAKCTKPSHNYCNKEDLQEIKGCAVSEALGWGMMNMDMLKYTDRKNCEKLVPCLKNPKTWSYEKRLIKEYAKYKSGHA